MNGLESFSLSIPADENGQVLLKCPVCRELFKVSASVFDDDSIFEIHCPSCGIVSDNYFTDEITHLAQDMIENYANDLIMKELKKIEKSAKRSSIISFKVKSNYKRHSEQPIMLKIENIVSVEYPCCHIKAGIKPTLKMCGGYCPYCGEKYYGIE